MPPLNWPFLIPIFFLALVPTLIWLFIFYLNSPRYTTPRKKLFQTFIFGCLSVLPGFLIENSIPSFFVINIFITNFILYFIIVSPTEEFVKFLAIRWALLKSSKKINQLADGLKLGLASGLGFATVENLLYFSTVKKFSISLLSLFLARTILSTPAHAIYSSILGLYIAKGYLGGNKIKSLLTGFFWAIIIHGVYDLLTELPFGILAINGLIGILLIVLLLWYQNRYSILMISPYTGAISFETASQIKEESEQLSQVKNKILRKILDKFNLCPYCFKKLKKLKPENILSEEEKYFCKYCGRIIIKKLFH